MIEPESIFKHISALSELGSSVARTEIARKAADARHGQPGGSRDKRDEIRGMWATGNYQSRDVCAEQECSNLGMSFSTARKALRNTPAPPLKPSPCHAAASRCLVGCILN